MPRYPIKSKSRDVLLAIATPDTASQPECVPACMYDSQTYTAATTLTQTFFSAINADRTLSNMDSAGQFPDPQFLEIFFINFDFLFPAVSTSATLTGSLNDMHLLLNAARAIFQINLSNKVYGPWPTAAAHSQGNFMPGGDVLTNSTAATTQQVATNGFPDGGMWIGGSIIIPPKLNFTVIQTFASVQTTLATPFQIRCSLVGNLHRRVL